jgi:hypothetical protein
MPTQEQLARIPHLLVTTERLESWELAWGTILGSLRLVVHTKKGGYHYHYEYAIARDGKTTRIL